MDIVACRLLLVMRLKAVPFTPIVGVHWGSDIEGLEFSGAELRVKVAREVNESGSVQGLEIIFASASSFRYLDEVELARYWSSEGFPKGSHVIEVLEGGWSDEENQLQGYQTQRREWLVVTGNGCVSVFCPNEPQIQPATWPKEA